MTIEAGGIPVNPAQLSELRSNLGILDFSAGGFSAATSGQTLVFSNSNGLSFGLNADGGSVLTGSYTVPETSAFLTTAALSNHSHGNPSLALTNLNGTTASNSAGLTLSLSAANQSVQTQNSVLVQGSSGQITFSASNGVSFGGNAGTITASVETSYAASNHSHGNPTLALTNLTGTTASASNGLTISLSAANPAADGGIFLSAAGSSQSAGQIVFSNSNGVSFGMNGSTVTASVVPGAAAGIAAIQGGTQTGTSGTVVFADSNGITFGMSGSSQITASHNGITSQSNQAIGLYATGNTTQNSSTTRDARSLSFNGLGAATVGFSNGFVQISVPTQTVQTQGSVAILGSTGAISFDNANGITFGANASTITASHNGLTTAALSNHSHGNPTLNLTNLSGTTASNSAGLTLSLSAAAPGAGVAISAGTQSVSTGTMVFSNSNGVTFGMSGSSRITASVETSYAASNHSHGDPTLALTNLSGTTASASNGLTISLSAAATVAQTAQTMGVYGSSQTYGQSSSSTVDARSFSIVGSGGISVGMSAGSLLISGQTTAAQTVQSQSNVQGIIVSDTTYRTGDVSFKNSNGISFGSNGANIVTASYTVPVQSAQTMGIYGSSQTTGQSSSSTVDARSLTFRGMGAASVGMSAGEVIISVGAGAQSAQTMGIYGSSQTYGQSSSSTVDARSLSVVGSGGISVGMSAGSLLISGQTTAAQSVQSMGLYASSQTYGQSSSSTFDARSLSIVGSGGISVGMSAGSMLISGQTTLAQSNQTQSNVQGIVVSDTTYRTGDVSFSNANGISFGSSAGQAITISHGLQFTSATSAITSNALHSSASRVINIVAATNSTGGGAASLSSNVSFSAANGLTFYTSAGGAIVGSHNALTTARASNDAIGLNTAQTNVTWTVNSSGLSLNAAGYAGTGTSVTGAASITHDSLGIKFNGAALAGTTSGFTGANISASITHNTLGLAMSMSVAPPGAATLTAYAVSNTTQSTSGTIPGNIVSFQGVGGISVGISNGSIIVQGPDLSSLSATGALSASSNGSTISLGVGTVTASIIGNTTQTSTGSINLNALVFSAAGGASLGFSAGSMIISGAGGVSAGMAAIGASNTTYTSGTVSLMAGAGAITIGSETGQRITFAVPATSSLVGASGISVSTAGSTISIGLGTANASAIGNTTQTSSGSLNHSGLVFSGAGGVSVGFSSGTVIVSGATGGGGGAAISAAGSSQNAGTLVFSNSNNVSFGMNGSTITATANPGVNGIGATNTTYVSGTVSLVAGAGAITIGSETGQRITFAVPATSSLVGSSGVSISTNGSTITVGLGTVNGSIIGNTTQNSSGSFNASGMVFSAAGQVSMGFSAGSIIVSGPLLSSYLFEPPGASSAGSAMTQGSMSFQKVLIPSAITITRIDVPVQISLASSAAANTGNLLISSGLVLYSISGGSTLNPIVGAFGTTTYTHASNTANFNSITGPRLFSFPIATVLRPGEYYVGVQLSTNNNSSIGTATTALAATVSLQHGAIYTASAYAEFGVVTATSLNQRPFVGVAASVTATNQTQQMSNITQTGTALMRANIAVGFRA